AERDACLSYGIPAARCHVIRPGVSMAAVEQQRREELRGRLGIGREDFVLLAPGESSYASDHRLAVHVASILHVLNRTFRVLLLGRGPQAASATELGRRLDQPRVVIRADQVLGDRVEFEEVAPAADVALVTARQIAPVMPWAMCMAAGLPIVSADGRQAREVFADAAASVESPGPRTLANRVLALSEDPAQARCLGQMAAMRAKELFGRERFIDEYHALYALLCQSESATERQVQRGSELSRITVTG